MACCHGYGYGITLYTFNTGNYDSELSEVLDQWYEPIYMNLLSNNLNRKNLDGDGCITITRVLKKSFKRPNYCNNVILIDTDIMPSKYFKTHYGNVHITKYITDCIHVFLLQAAIFSWTKESQGQRFLKLNLGSFCLCAPSSVSSPVSSSLSRS